MLVLGKRSDKMNYFIKRELTEYGPYSLADLQKYVASGNILLTDLCRSEGLTDWVPVSQVIGNIPVPVAAPQPAPGMVYGGGAGATAYGTQGGYAAPAGQQYPPPPSLHWGICILLTVVTCTLFCWVWAFVAAVWMKKVQPNSKAIIFYSVAAGIWLLSVCLGAYYGATEGLQGINSGNFRATFWIFRLAIAIAAIFGNFNLRTSIEEHYNSAEPIGLSLNGVMTFFFGVLYFQYHFTRINEMKQRQMGGYGR
jgi:hypothetical protein